MMTPLPVRRGAWCKHGATAALAVAALVLAVLDRSAAVWSLDALVLAVAGVVWLAVSPRSSRWVRSAGADASVAGCCAAGALAAVRLAPAGWMLLALLALGVAGYAWTSPARSTVPPVAAVAAGGVWLAWQMHGHPVATVVDLAKFAAAVALIAAGLWSFTRSALRSLRVVWRHALALVVAAAAVPVIVPWLRGLDTLAFAAFGLALLSGAVAFGALRGSQARRRERERERTRPMQILGEHVAGLIGWRGKDADALFAVEGERTIVRQWPDDPAAAGAVIACRYQKGWHASDTALAQVEKATSQCQGGQWTATTDPGRRWVILTRLVELRLPKRFDYPDDPAAPVTRIPIAIRPDGSTVHLDLTVDAAHAVIGATTGAGKTSTLTVIVAHVAARGGLVDVCDPKRIGFMPFRGLPGVHLHTSPDTMAAAVTEFEAEVDRRFALIEDAGEENAADDLPLRLLVVDEKATFADVTPRATAASLMKILRLGRAARCHVVVAAHQVNADVIGKTEGRSLFAYRIGAGAQEPESWRMLFGNQELPALPTGPGRAVAGVGRETTACQLAYITPTRAREVAARGTARFPDDVPVQSPRADRREPLATRTGPRSTAGPTATNEGAFERWEGELLTADRELEPSDQTDPTDRPRARARWTPPKPTEPTDRPTDREPVEMVCNKCGHQWQTRAKSRTSINCPACKHPRKVPRRPDHTEVSP